MSAVWIGIGILLLIIIAFIITIVVLNRGNDIDIINELPHYKIFYPESKGYLQLMNVPPEFSQSYNVGDPFWQACAVINNSDSLNIWAFDDTNISSSFAVLPPGSKYVKLANVVYNETGIGYVPQSQTGPPSPPVLSKIGYIQEVQININEIRAFRLVPTAGPINADVFIYTDLGNNQFTLKLRDFPTRGVSVDKNNIPYVANIANNPLAKFQLTLIK